MKASSGSIRIAVLGAKNVGKSAVTVRFLTKRFIGEYNSNADLLYRTTFQCEESSVCMEMLDTCSKKEFKSEDITPSWAHSYVIIYSVCDRSSFDSARKTLDCLNNSRIQGCTPILLLGNKTDLVHMREIDGDEGERLALQYGCRHEFVSAAEDYTTIRNIFQKLLTESRIVQQQRATLPKKRRSSLTNVSKKIGAVFGKKYNSLEKKRAQYDVIDIGKLF